MRRAEPVRYRKAKLAAGMRIRSFTRLAKRIFGFVTNPSPGSVLAPDPPDVPLRPEERREREALARAVARHLQAAIICGTGFTKGLSKLTFAATERMFQAMLTRYPSLLYRKLTATGSTRGLAVLPLLLHHVTVASSYNNNIFRSLAVVLQGGAATGGW